MRPMPSLETLKLAIGVIDMVRWKVSTAAACWNAKTETRRAPKGSFIVEEAGERRRCLVISVLAEVSGTG